jgi:Flp pilus assembly protein TadD
MLLLLSIVLASVSIDEALVRLRCETGEAYFEQGLLEEAESEFRDALRLEPGCMAATLGLGRVYRIREAWEQSEVYLRQYNDSLPSDPDGQIELALLLLETGRPAEAAGFARGAAEGASTDGEAWLLSGTAALAASDTSSARLSLGRALDLGGTAALDAAVMIASMDIARGLEEDAQALLQWAVDADHAPACFKLGRLYVSWGDLVRGSALLERSLFLSPSGAYADSCRLMIQDLAASGFFTSVEEDQVEN